MGTVPIQYTFATIKIQAHYTHPTFGDFILPYHVALRRLHVPEYGHGPEEGDPRRVHRDENAGLLLVPRCIGVRLTHEDADLAVDVACACDPPLAPVDHVVAVLLVRVGVS